MNQDRKRSLSDLVTQLQNTADALGTMESQLNTATFDDVSPSELSKLAQGVSAVSRLRVDVLCRLIDLEKGNTETQATEVARFPTMKFLETG